MFEIHLPEQTAVKLQQVAERLSVSPEQLLVLSIEEKPRSSKRNSAARLIMCSRRTPTSIAAVPDAFPVS